MGRVGILIALAVALTFSSTAAAMTEEECYSDAPPEW